MLTQQDMLGDDTQFKVENDGDNIINLSEIEIEEEKNGQAGSEMTKRESGELETFRNGGSSMGKNGTQDIFMPELP